MRRVGVDCKLRISGSGMRDLGRNRILASDGLRRGFLYLLASVTTALSARCGRAMCSAQHDGVQSSWAEKGGVPTKRGH